MEALPSFLGHKDVQINVPELGKVRTKHLQPAPINPIVGHIGLGFWWHVVCHSRSRSGNWQATDYLTHIRWGSNWSQKMERKLQSWARWSRWYIKFRFPIKPPLQVSCQDQHPVEHPTMSYPGPDILVFTGPPRCTVHLVDTYLFNLSLARKTEHEISTTTQARLRGIGN